MSAELPGLSAELCDALVAIVGATNFVTDEDKVAKASKDFYWYSPILKPLLDDKVADAVVRPESIEALRAVVALASRHGIPLVPRGGGTGNYGQCIPLYRGIVLDFSGLDRFEITPEGVLVTEPGARLGVIEPTAREVGWELRCMPSTWVKSSIGGFLCGGSGGIGSITWGGITQPGTVKAIEVMSVEAEPKITRFEEEACVTALHTYGTTGILVGIEMRLGPAVPYEELIFTHPEWDVLLDWTDGVARRTDWRKRLVTQFEAGILPYFRPLKKHLGEQPDHTTFLLVDKAQATEVIASAEAVGANLAYRNILPTPLKPPYITDYTWNHTTLWALKSDPAITYLQSGFTADFRNQFKKLWARFPGEILFHLEWTTGNSKMRTHAQRMNPDSSSPIMVGGIPLVRFKSPERLQEIIDYCTEIGVGTANPHTYLLEEGGQHPDIAEKIALRAEMDPGGLLNPGKMKAAPFNPFASVAV